MRHLFLLLAALPDVCGAGETAQYMQDRLLSSIDGNQVQISMAQAQSQPVELSFVSICLTVPHTPLQAKGFETKAHEPHFTEPDQMSCTRVAPRVQRIILLTQTEESTVHRSMAFTADLTGFGGHQLNINWIVEVVK